MYYRARYYDPALGRFTSVDPLGPAGGINAYAYADNDPVSNTDPSGLMPESTVSRGLQGIMPTYFDRQFGLGGPSITWRASTLEQAQSSYSVNARANAAGQFALGFIPGYNLYRAATNPNANTLDWTAGVLGVLPGLGKGAALGAKGFSAAVPLIGGAVREVRAVEAVAATGLREVPWSNKSVRDAAKALEGGATELRVGSRSEAEEIFLGRYQGQGYRNSSGMLPTEAKNFFGGKSGTYHWDEGVKNFPHGTDHLQIHTFEGDVVRVYFP